MTSDQISVGQYREVNSVPLALVIAPELVSAVRMDLEYYRPRYIEAVARLKSSGIPLRALDTLRDSRRIITDGIRQHAKTQSGVVLLRTQNFDGVSLSLDDCAYVDVEQHRAAQKSAVHANDLLIAIRGYLGKAAIVGADIPTANINQHIARVSVDPNKADVGYLWAFFCSDTGTALLEQQATGTVQQGIMLPIMREFQVPIPSRPVQDYIGAKVRLAERCRSRARKLSEDVQSALNQLYMDAPVEAGSELNPWVDPREINPVRLA